MIARVGRKEKGRDDSRKGGFKFKYKARTAEDVKKRAEQSGGNFDSPVKGGVDMWRPKSGENVIRILPPTWEGYDHYGYEVFMHRFVGSDNSNYICPNKMRDKPCCICDEAKELKADGEDEDAKKIAYQKRVWVYIIDRDDKQATPQIWDMSWSQDRDISQLSTYSNGKVLLIDHPDDGFDVIVKKTGSGKTNTKYAFNIERDSSPIHDDREKQDEILEFITEHPIPDCIKIFSNEHLEKKMSGSAPAKDKELDEDEDEPKGKKRSRSRDEDEDEEETPRRGKGRARDEEEDEEQDDPPKRRKGRAADPDEDEEDDPPAKKKRRPEPEDEDEEDEPAPKKKRRPDPDEDEEDEPKPKKKRVVEEDEDEEDEPPKRKKRVVEEDEDEEDDDRPRRRR
jgi:hypothetical protein